MAQKVVVDNKTSEIPEYVYEACCPLFKNILKVKKAFAQCKAK